MVKQIAIMGGGIAGVTLAWQAHYAGYTVHLFDEVDHKSPSRVAAGIINPLSFNRKKPMWNSANFTEETWSFFNKFNAPFVYPQEMEVVINSAKQKNDWATSVANEQGWINWNKDGTTITIKGSGRIGTEDFLTHLPCFDFNIENSRVDLSTLLDADYERVVVATGKFDFSLEHLQFRSDIFRPVLGDILEVELVNNYPFSHLEGLFIIPLEKKGTYLLGSTYIHEFTSSEPTHERADLLVHKAFLQGVNIKKIVAHRAAVRPAVYDRMPLVGNIKRNLDVFVGMGSRGLFHAPLLAKQLVNHWQGKEALFPMVDIKRCLIK